MRYRSIHRSFGGVGPHDAFVGRKHIFAPPRTYLEISSARGPGRLPQHQGTRTNMVSVAQSEERSLVKGVVAGSSPVGDPQGRYSK